MLPTEGVCVFVRVADIQRCFVTRSVLEWPEQPIGQAMSWFDTGVIKRDVVGKGRWGSVWGGFCFSHLSTLPNGILVLSSDQGLSLVAKLKCVAKT